MKKKLLSPAGFICVWILIYVVVLVCGSALSVLIVLNNNTDFLSIARRDMNYYTEHGDFNPEVIVNSGNNLIYTSDGEKVDTLLTIERDSDFDYDFYAQKYLAKTQSGETVYTILFNTGLQDDFAIAIAIPMEDGQMFLFLREFSSLKTMLQVLFLSSTLMVILSVIYTALIIRKNREIEQVQREYIDNVSHELKSPIASVRALTETMYDGLVPEEEKRKKYCEIMLNELHSLEHTVSDMLELSRIQSKQIDCQKTTVAASDVFFPILRKYEALCEDMGLSFTWTPSPELWPALYTDKSLAARLTDILLDNAVKFSGDEGSVAIRYSHDLKRITISVINSGRPIPVEDQPHIFSRFYKGDKSHNGKGSGLGLAIAQEIAASLDEKLWLSKSNATGTEFCFSLKKG